MITFARRTLLFGAGAALGAIAATRLAPRLPTLAGIAPPPDLPGDTLNDASLLSETPIHRHLILSDDPGEALVARIRAEMAEARAAGRPVALGAARHSMGGQAIPRDGHALTFETAFLEPDTEAGTYRAHAGLRWREAIAALDPVGLSPAVMQSNHDFGLAATFSVNAHGWAVPHGPMGSTVRSLTMVLPDGSLVRASRDEEPDLFRLAMGGYGLIGAITEMEVEAAPNRRLVPEFRHLDADGFGPAFAAAVREEGVEMAYGRLDVARGAFFENALMILYRPDIDQSDLPSASGSGFVSHAAARVFRAQLGREGVKDFRWWVESGLGPTVAGGPVTRNSLLNEPVVTIDDRDPARTDILHEYFVAPEAFGDFLTACREVIPASYQEMLNVTLRWVEPDAESLLSFAPVPRIAAVMLFSQEMTARAEADMARMTRDLIDRVTEIGGTYYLPYRPHATVDQLLRAYPGAPDFAARKRALDPGLLFRNALWDSYLVHA